MKKAEYLSQPEVQAFIAWMARHLQADSCLKHEYNRPRRARPVTFENLADALRQYDWEYQLELPGGAASSGRTLAENTQALDSLQAALRQAVESGDDAGARDAAIAVMRWGGVANGNVSWLQQHADGLAAMLRDTAAILRSGDEELVPPGLRFNAGMTKVYSLLVDQFIIYDSRVAGALCWFVLRWATENKEARIPAELNFPCLPAKEGPNPEIRKVRNPGTGLLRFDRMGSRPLLHAQWNLRASWLLEAVLAAAGATVFNNVRELEAALFMWGYDLGSATIPAPAEEETSGSDDDETGGPSDGRLGYELHTLGGKARPFRWYYDDEASSVVILRDGDTVRLEAASLFRLLHALYDEFEWDSIPLANSVSKIPEGIEKSGLGMALKVELNLDPTIASSLACVLLAIGQLRWNGRKKNIEFQFSYAPPASIAIMREQLAAYTA